MISFNFNNKSVIVSGGGTGIGKEIAKSFIEHGASVTITGRRSNILEKTVKHISKEYPESKANISFYKCDMSNENLVSKLFKNVKKINGRIDILINNCGDWSLTKINKLDDDHITKHFNNVLKTTILSTKFASNYLSEQGAIINIGSFAGIIPIRNGSIYSLLKSAINTFTKSSAAELGKQSIRVNCIIPGLIKTPMTSDYIDKNYNSLIKPISLGRIGECKEVSNAVLFLCSDLASYVTGATLEVSGGKYLTQL